MHTVRLGRVKVRLDDPSVVALSVPGETRWGYHQFPVLSRLPDQRLLATFNDGPDCDDAYGRPGPARVSGDGGRTWQPADLPDPLLSVSHSPVSEVAGGEYFCAPMSPPQDLAAGGIVLPEPSGRMDSYGEVLFHRLDQCPPAVPSFLERIPAVRWIPAAGAWKREEIAWDIASGLARVRTGEGVIPRPYIDNRVLRHAGLLYYADYHFQRLLPDGSLPKSYAAWCLVSRDNGRSWRRHGLIAYDPAGRLMMGEPCLFPTADGALACVIRCANQRQAPLLIARSRDGGLTWSEPRRLHDFGVMPQGLLLANGIAAVSFGRPGVHLLFSPDGAAGEWVGPVSLVAGAGGEVTAHSCGYTRLLAVADDAFLAIYSDFNHRDERGQACKAILVRKIAVGKGKG